MSNSFRELLKKVGSGEHTSKNLTREEAKVATKMMLLQEATPAQIGAFMIAHRIKRPTPIELAGMLDAYDELGPKLELNHFKKTITVLGTPYDGRDRTAPVTPITALILATVGIPVLMHGGDSFPTKHGLPLIQIWQGLGADFSHLSLQQTQELLEKTGIGFIYLPKHFNLAQNLIPYRDQIGKRPPFATVELIWCPCIGNVHLVAGFVHPPTEERFQETLKLRGINNFTTIKGLEGSCDLSRSRTAIIGRVKNGNFERILLNPRDYDFGEHDVPLDSPNQLIEQLKDILAGKPGELRQSAIWNGGFYLWLFDICSDIKTGFSLAETMLKEGKVAEKLREVSSYLRK